MKLLVISDYSLYHTVRPEAEIFLGLKNKGIDVHVMTYPGSAYYEKFSKAGIHVVPFHPEKKASFNQSLKIRQYVIDHDIDILHAFNNPAIIQSIKALKGLKTKLVLYRGYCGNIHWWDPLSYRTFLHPSVDMIMCNSEGVEKLIKSQISFQKAKPITINKGHKSEWYSEIQSIDIRAENKIPEDAMLLVNVANNRRMKGIPYLLKAMGEIKSENIHLLLIGNGMDNDKNKSIVNDRQISETVHFLGFRKDVLSIVKSCDAFVSSSIKGESITKSVIEAMSLGLAPIITDIPGNTELVVHGKSGLVVPFKNSSAIANGIKTFYKDKNLLKLIQQEAPKHIEKHLNHNATVEKLLKAYSSLL